ALMDQKQRLPGLPGIQNDFIALEVGNIHAATGMFAARRVEQRKGRLGQIHIDHAYLGNSERAFPEYRRLCPHRHLYYRHNTRHNEAHSYLKTAAATVFSAHQKQPGRWFKDQSLDFFLAFFGQYESTSFKVVVLRFRD
ncbi:MAG: hypothetical protein L0J67_10040, partial [Halomonas sp.]